MVDRRRVQVQMDVIKGEADDDLEGGKREKEE